MNFKTAAFAVIAATTATVAFAAPITPTFTTFGTLGGATFGGSGIPNTAVAINTSVSGLTLGLTAHQRFVGPDLANDGAGTFTAFAGVSNGAPSPADPYATWNFGFYIGGTNVSQYIYRLYYDFDAGIDTDQSLHGYTSSISAGAVTTVAQNSWNLGMNFLATSGITPGVGQVVAPGGVFNPAVGGQYTFALVAGTQTAGAGFVEVARTAIRVNVVPEPGTLALVGLALAGAGLVASRRRR